jgi:predicted TIM-barrel fold metal-dependent hydrolase
MANIVIDAHVHSLRFSPGIVKSGEEWAYDTLEEKLFTTQPWDNSPRLLLDMDRNRVDIAVLNSAFNMRNEMIYEQVRRNPNKFVGLAGFIETLRKVYAGESKFSEKAAAEELDQWLEKPEFVGAGELLALPDPSLDTGWEENFRKIIPIMEVIKKHQKPVLFHTGWIKYPNARLKAVDPGLIDELALMYPSVPIIVGHMGVQAGWYQTFPEIALMVAARHDNVYLESSQATSEQIYRAYLDPHIGPSKILYGSDYGTSISYSRIGDRTYATTHIPPKYLPDHFGWNIRQIQLLDIPEDDRNQILGLNAAKIFKLDLKKFGLKI